MSTALSSGVSGLQAHQRMLDVAGNNLANVNTTAFKASKVNFAELFAQTLIQASGPTSITGGTNPQQTGSGVGIASIARDSTQGNIVKTGNPLDAAIEGEGFFVLSDGEKNLFSRAGTFAVDADSNLVEASTGYRVQRFGTVGESDNFQVAGDSDITIPYDKSIEPSATENITMAGNLSADQSLTTTQTQVITSNTTFTTDGSTKASTTTQLDELYGYNAGSFSSGLITISGTDHDGNAISGTMAVATGNETMADLISAVNTVLGTTATATLSGGQIKITDASSGYSLLDINVVFSNSGTASFDTGTMPAFFEYTTTGGTEVKDINLAVYDHQGTKYTMTASFVRSNTANEWDFVMSSLTGPSNAMIEYDASTDRRVRGITFNEDSGAYAGLNSTIGDSATFDIDFGASTGVQTITLDLGTAGQFTGITQVAGASTAVATDQDGYPKGDLSSVSIDAEGNLVGTFTNGIRKNVASLQLALFDNPEGLESVGKGLFITSGNSGDPTSVQALTRGAGKVHGSSLEKSNADVATEFVNLIEAQNGYQANARTIRVANDILQELANLVR
ncbi:flagellar hook protein FlgE [Planctomycetota bacterium]